MGDTPAYSLGVDFGTGSVRAIIVDTRNGKEVGESVFPYPTGTQGVILDPSVPDLARQNPRDYLDGLEASIRGAIEEALAVDGFDPARIVGIGVDTTGSTPLPVDADGVPLAFDTRFDDNPDAQVWLWKDHTSHAEAAEITRIASEIRPEYLRKCGGVYSSEWFWANIWRCLNVAPDVFDAAHTWVEYCDWIPAVLTGTDHPSEMRRCICAAGHKAMYHPEWGGYPDDEFIAALDPALVRIRRSLPDEAYAVDDIAGRLTDEWAGRLGLEPGIPVAIGAFDAHLGGVGSGIREGTLVKILGTASCDILTAPLAKDLPDIPGLCGIVPESVLPGQYGLEAGQSGMGDVFNWLVEVVKPDRMSHGELTAEAERMRPGESGLLALDWLSGNRTVLVDQRLTGLILGLNLQTSPAQLYRTLVEAVAFGARVILERFLEYGVRVDRVVTCGGISVKNRMVLQIYADVLQRPIGVARSSQTCALGAAMAGAVAAGASVGGHDDFEGASRSMTGLREEVFEPVPENVAVYDRLFTLYRRLHDGFGVFGGRDDFSDVMKTLLDLRDEVRESG